MSMKLILKPHRTKVLADRNGQKLFVLLSVVPEKQDISISAKISSVFVVDISGSMSAYYGGTRSTKLDLVKKSLSEISTLDLFDSSDQVGLITFDTSAYIVLRSEPFNKQSFLSAVSSINVGGGTSMDEGMRAAIDLLDSADNRHDSSRIRKIFLFTDGETMNEDECIELARECKQKHIEIVSFGVGDEYNENLLMEISDLTGGRARHITDLSIFSQYMDEEISLTKKEAITGADIQFRVSKGVEIVEGSKVVPNVIKLSVSSDRIELGNLLCDRENSFIITLNVPKRPPSKVRLAQAIFKYKMPGAHGGERTEETTLIVDYTMNQNEASITDREVMHYIQQLKVVDGFKQIVELTKRGDIEKATQILEQSRKTVTLTNNQELAKTIEMVGNELRKTGKLSNETIKTVKLETRTKTQSFNQGIIDEDEMRKISGT